MTGYIFSYCCAIIILLLGHDTYGYSSRSGLSEGSQCTTRQGVMGVCKKLPECPLMLADNLAGRTEGEAAGLCGFDGLIEIVCCPTIYVRPSEKACQAFANEIASDINYANRHGDPPTASLPGDDADINFFIYNGDRAAAGEFPYMAALGYPNRDLNATDPIIYMCGGSLISSKYVLTAAHCLKNVKNLVPEWVRLGSENTRSTEAQMIPIKRMIRHPQHHIWEQYYDVALVELQEQVKFSTRIKPICLPTMAPEKYIVNSTTSFITIGYGVTDVDEEVSDHLMKTANLTLVPTTVCNESYTSHFDFKLRSGLDSAMICALDANSSKRSDACQSDSGGPFIMITETAHTLLAITAFGHMCATSIPSVYTSVYSYIDWIEAIVWPEKTTS